MVEGCAMVAHSLVLRARCEYFRTMLGAGMQVGESHTQCQLASRLASVAGYTWTAQLAHTYC
jgi:hypothetical protein